jgi:hypothetical protein
MSREPYPDRDDWPAYWRAIRTAAVWAVVIVLIVGGGAVLPRPDAPLPAIAVEVLIGVAVVTVATVLARRVNDWWERRAS